MGASAASQGPLTLAHHDRHTNGHIYGAALVDPTDRPGRHKTAGRHTGGARTTVRTTPGQARPCKGIRKKHMTGPTRVGIKGFRPCQPANKLGNDKKTQESAGEGGVGAEKGPEKGPLRSQEPPRCAARGRLSCCTAAAPESTAAAGTAAAGTAAESTAAAGSPAPSSRSPAAAAAMSKGGKAAAAGVRWKKGESELKKKGAPTPTRRLERTR